MKKRRLDSESGKLTSSNGKGFIPKSAHNYSNVVAFGMKIWFLMIVTGKEDSRLWATPGYYGFMY